MCAGVCPRDRRRRRRGVFASRRDREHPELWHGHIGSGGGAGGGAGEYYEGELAVAPGIPLAITIGAGGGPGSSTTDGTAGGQTLIQQGASVLKSLSGGGGAVAPRTPSAVFRGGRRTAGRHRHGLVRGLERLCLSARQWRRRRGFAIRRGGLADIDRVPQLCRRRRLSAAFPRLGRGRWRRRWFVGRRQWLLRDWRGGTLRRRHIGVLNDTGKHAYP